MPYASAYCPPSALQVTREVFEASKGRLKVVGRAGVGIDNVDLTAASELGCLGACAFDDACLGLLLPVAA